MSASPALDAWLQRVDGLFVGLLSEEELHDFALAVKLGLARESYEGAAGFLGVPKIRRVSP
jgi:hypothetical protein